MELASESLQRLPKAELHVHLDGSLRPDTMLELARERDLTLPASDPLGVARAMRVGPGRSLEEYLEPFAVTLSLMQDADALERVAYELVLDHVAENVRHLEVRFCPALCTRGDLASPDVLDAVLAGLGRGREGQNIDVALIVCALRTLPAAHSREMAELAISYMGRGVCALDLAGAEAGHPVHDHADAFRVAGEAGLPVTIHAGEAYGPDSIREAIDLGGARRIGHGTRLGEDPDLTRAVRDAGIALEVCLTSNVQTGAVDSYAAHPARLLFEEGVRICLCTDNRLVSGVTLTEEYEHAVLDVGFSWDEISEVARTGFESAFASRQPDERGP